MMTLGENAGIWNEMLSLNTQDGLRRKEMSNSTQT